MRSYLRAYGPSTPALLARWAGITRSQAQRAWDLAEAELLPAGGGWILERDRERFATPEPATGVRLLPPGDPLLLDRDRETLFADPALRKQVWKPIGSPGVVLAGGRPAGVWRPRKQGRRLAISVEPFEKLTKADRAGIEEEAERAAPHRGATSVSVTYD